MSNAIINIDTALDSSGDANDEVVDSHAGRLGPRGAIQWRVTGPLEHVDIFLEARLRARLGWQDFVSPRRRLSLPVESFGRLGALDVADEIRVRIVKRDPQTDRTADVDAVVAVPA